MKTNILLFIAVFGLQSFAGSFGLNDVSVLFPLSKGALEKLWAPDTGSQKMGALLPADKLKLLPQLIESLEQDQVLASMRVVSLRLDPCFGAECARQIRLVWQPIRATDKGRLFTFDAALHSFYSLSKEEWNDLLGSYRGLLTEQGEPVPLSVHPVLRQQGLSGEFMASLSKVVLAHIGGKNLVRLTFMSLSGAADQWHFGGFDFQEAKSVPMMIPRIESLAQTFVNSAMPRLYYDGASIAPQPKGQDTVSMIFTDSKALQPEAEEQVVNEVQSLLRMEHPDMHNPATLDCVSCHTAQSARTFAETRFPWRMHDFHHSVYRYMNENHDLRNTSPVKHVTGNLRAFGYFADQAAISQRTINESAVVADALNR